MKRPGPGWCNATCVAVPFFRWMLAGDLFYLAILLGCAALAGLPLTKFGRKLQVEPVAVRR